METFVATATAALQPLADLVWGWPTIILLLLTGCYLMLLLGFQPIRRLPGALWQLVGPRHHDPLAKGTISNRAALWTALAATVGTGNIAGVATAIALGGPGAVFWMWVSGVLGLGLKFAETTLGVHYRQTQPDGSIRGGPMYYLRYGARLPSLGVAYAVALAFAALSIGGMVQSNSMADVMATSFGFSPLLVGLAITVAAGAIMLGGLSRIAQAASALVPFMIGLYVVVGCIILALNASYLPAVFTLIFESAFSPASASGGFAGAAVAAAMRYGLARGIFSNESGLGSAAIVAAPARTRHPVEQGLIAMTQTFIDTLIVCTFTALVILVSGAWQMGGVASGGAALSAAGFDAGLGFMQVGGYGLGSAVVAVCLFLFAFTTILGWGYYGQQGAVYVFGPKVATPYLYGFLVVTFLGAALLEFAPDLRQGVALVWLTADVTVALMLIPNLIALLILGPKVRTLLRDWLYHQRTGLPLQHAAFYQGHHLQAEPAAASPAKAAPQATPPSLAKRPQAAQRTKASGKAKVKPQRRR